jgi:hypothetical protein
LSTAVRPLNWRTSPSVRIAADAVVVHMFV